MLRHADSSEPAGYYDKQDQAIEGGRELARKLDVSLVIHATDGTVRDRTGAAG